MYLVAYETKCADAQDHDPIRGWQWRVTYFESDVGARLHYESMLSACANSTGEIVYRNQTWAKCKDTKFTRGN